MIAQACGAHNVVYQGAVLLAMLRVASTKCLLEHGEARRAREMVESVVTEPLTEDPVLNVAWIANTNKDVVRGMIAAVET